MIKNADIFKISSEHCLKNLFSFLEYKQILNLARNSRLLQNKLGLKSSNYKQITNYQYIKRTIKKYSIMPITQSNQRKKMKNKCKLSILIIIFLEYTIMYCYYINFTDYFEKIWNSKISEIFVKIINYSLIPFIIFCFMSYAYILCFLFKNYLLDHPDLKKRKSFIIKIIILIFIIYQFVITYKLIIRDNTFIFDIIFFILNFINIIILLCIRDIFLKYSGKDILFLSGVVLSKYKDIDINFFLLPNNFMEKSKKAKKDYIFQNYNAKKYKINISKEYMDLINSINNYRVENNLGKLIAYKYNNTLPEFIIKENSEMMLLQYEKIFRLNKNKYVFRYYLGEFEKKFKANDKKIMEILLNENLNRIEILRQGNFEYIYVYSLMDLELSIPDNIYIENSKENKLLFEKKITEAGVVCKEIIFDE
jgi:hypothetical protein